MSLGKEFSEPLFWEDGAQLTGGNIGGMVRGFPAETFGIVGWGAIRYRGHFVLGEAAHCADAGCLCLPQAFVHCFRVAWSLRFYEDMRLSVVVLPTVPREFSFGVHHHRQTQGMALQQC